MLLPSWMADNLGVGERSIVRISNTSLPKATYAKFRILTEALWDVFDMRSVLESALRRHSCLTVGDVVAIEPYSLQVLDVRPATPQNAVCIIETDCEVDFEERPPPPPPVPLVPVATNTRRLGRFASHHVRNTALFPGSGHTLG